MIRRRSRRPKHCSRCWCVCPGRKGGREKRHLDELLDEGLKETFPASDPVAVGHFTSTEAPSRPADTAVVDLTSVGKTKGRRKQTRARRYG